MAITPLNHLTPTQANKQFPGIDKRKVEIEQLMDRVLSEDDYMAFQLLFKRMYSPLCQFCIKFVQAREIAEELVSDVFYNVWKNRKRIIVTSPKAYLFTSVRNKAYDHLRKIKKSIWVDLNEANHLASENTDSQDIMIQHELSQKIERSIAGLPKQCRLIFELSRDHGMKYKEIATMLNISIKTVETQMGRALKNLRQSFPAP